MLTEQIRSFLEVYRQGTVSRASTALGLTQPAVSNHIAALEAAFGRKLFVRHSKGMKPTQVSHDLAREIGGSIDKIDEITSKYRSRNEEMGGQISIGGPSDLLSDLITGSLAGLIQDGFEITLRPTRGSEHLDWLVDGEVDFVYAAIPPDDARLSHAEIGAEELVLASSPDLADRIGRETDLIKGLIKYPHVDYTIDNWLLENWLTENNLDHRLVGPPCVLMPDMRALRNFVKVGLGWTFLPRYLIKTELEQGDIVALTPPVRNLASPIFLLWARASMRAPRLLKARDTILANVDK